MSKHDLKVGQQLWFVPRERRSSQPKFVTVTKVGRDWAYVSGHRHNSRVSLVSLDIDGGEYASPGRCYLNREEYEQQVAATTALHQVAQGVKIYGLTTIPLSDILQAAKLLKIEVKL